MLVSLPALLAAKFRAAALPATLLDQGLAVAGPSHASLLEGGLRVVSGHVVQLVVDGAILDADWPVSCDKPAGRKTRGRGWQAPHEPRPRQAILGYGVPSGVDRDGEGHGHVAGFLEGRGNRCHVCTRIRHALAARNAVGTAEGAAEERV